MSFVAAVEQELGSFLCIAQSCDVNHLSIDSSVPTKLNNLTYSGFHITQSKVITTVLV